MGDRPGPPDQPLLHVAFVLFVVLLVLRWPCLAWIHMPAAMWGIGIEWAGWECPRTPLESWLWARGEEGAYAGDAERYLSCRCCIPEGSPASCSSLRVP